MNIPNNKNKRTSFFKALALCLFAAMSFTSVSCDDDMDIQQSYPFTVETMPVPNKVTKGQTVEIRCELKKTGDFANTLYTIRYFQFEGEGSLKMDNGITFLPNCSKTKSSACITRQRAMKRIISSWWWKIISETPLSWNLSLTTGMRKGKARPSCMPPTSNLCQDDACVHGYPLFALGGLLRVCTEQPPRGNGQAGGYLPSAAYGTGVSVYPPL